MKFSTVSALLGLAAGASAGALTPRRLQSRSLEVVMRVMTDVYDHMGRLDAAIAAVDGYDDLQELKQRGNEMIETIASADGEVVTMTPVTLQEAIQFQPLSNKLNAQGDTLLGDVHKKVPTFSELGVCPEALDMITKIGNGVIKLMGDVADKFPKDNQTQANQGIIQHFTQAFASAEAELKTCAGSQPNHDTWVTVTAVFYTTTCDKSTGMTVPTGAPAPHPTVAFEAVPTSAPAPHPTVSLQATPAGNVYPRPSNGSAAYPTPSSVVVVAGAAAPGVALGAVAMVAAAYML